MSDGSDDWRNRGSCRGEDPEMFFPDAYTDPTGYYEREAKACCWSCPVRRQCLWFAIDRNLHHGIYGGRTADERDMLRKRLEAVIR